jgi:hypothetical protein
LFPTPPTALRVLAAFAGWLGVLVLPLSGVLTVATWFMYRGKTDHGASAFAAGGLLAAGALLGAAHGLIRLENAARAAVRLIGAGVLGVGAWVAVRYPIGWLQDSYSFPLAGALIFAGFTVLQLLAALSLVRAVITDRRRRSAAGR